MIAALFVDSRGPYVGLPGVEVWDEARDARLYEGPHPVVAHPPCARWSKLAPLCEARYGIPRGQDDGCFAAALAAVRRFGGVLEHPAQSAAWLEYGLFQPNGAGGWTTADFHGGWTCRVDQSQFGHKAQKATWLYAHGVTWLPSLPWNRKPGDFVVISYKQYTRDKPAMKKSERHITPPAFRDVLMQMARSARHG
jgi:hypothetical protein